MKKLLLFAAAVLLFASCAVQQHNTKARLTEVQTAIVAPVVADLDISPTKITYTYKPTTTELRKTDLNTIINNAIAWALEENGNADVLVNASCRTTYSGLRIKSIIITGYPATVKEFSKPTEPYDYYFYHDTPYIPAR
ncbi:MAG: hypothetical protein J5759_05960 [Bacteroidales bacterium]|nr:hypothetical protein [Bacteroidales bacterium]